MWARRVLDIFARPGPESSRSTIAELAAAKRTRDATARRVDRLVAVVADYRDADDAIRSARK